MCGRYVPPDDAALERFWRIDRRNWQGWIESHFNVAPTTVIPIIVQAKDGARELIGARWGLIPSWWRNKTPVSMTFNVRSDEAAEQSTWRECLRSMRCLIPACGWYEWKEREPVRSDAGQQFIQPYFIFCPHAEVIAFAGLWHVRGSTVSCALLSKIAAPSIEKIHHRMPAVLKREHLTAWIDPSTSIAQARALIADAREDFEGYPVSTKVNNTRNDFPELLNRLQVT